MGTYKLEKISPTKEFFKQLTDVHALKMWVRKKIRKIPGKDPQRYIRTHCALYHLETLRKLNLSFQVRGLLTSGEHLCLRLNEEGYDTQLLDSEELMRYMVGASLEARR